jgi:hypothetical protein
VGKPERLYGYRGYSWKAQQRLAQEDYADVGQRTNPREYPTQLSQNARSQRTWQEGQSRPCWRGDSAEYLKATLKQLWGEAYHGSDGRLLFSKLGYRGCWHISWQYSFDGNGAKITVLR